MARITITTTISTEDHEFCKKHGLKWSRLLENAINITKRAYDEGDNPDLIKHYNKRINEMRERIDKLKGFIESKDLLQEFANSI